MLSAPLALSTGTSDAFQLGPLAIIALLYARRAHKLAADDHRVPAWRQACFYGGFAVIAVALVSLGSTSKQLLWVHTIESLLIGDIAALLVVLGLTGALLAPLLHVRALDRLRVLSHPALAFPLWAIDLYSWHLSSLYQAALRHAGIQVLEHAMLLGFAINMWMCLAGPLPRPGWFGNLARLIYILAVRLAGAALGNIFLWSGSVFYPYYLAGDARFHVSPLADQSIAGAIMVGEGSIVTLGLFYWLFRRTTRESGERQELLDYAGAHGLELTEARAAHAVAAGRASELRARLQARAAVRERMREVDAAAAHRQQPAGASERM